MQGCRCVLPSRGGAENTTRMAGRSAEPWLFPQGIQQVDCFVPTLRQALCSTGIIIQEHIENQLEPLYSFSPCYRFGQGVLQILSHLNPKEVTIFFCSSTLTENISAIFQAEEFWDFCKQVWAPICSPCGSRYRIYCINMSNLLATSVYSNLSIPSLLLPYNQALNSHVS